MENITPEQEDELRNLFLRMNAAIAQKKGAEADETSAKTRIREILAESSLPIEDGASEYLNIGQRSLRITRPKEGAPAIDPEKFRERLDNDWLFLKVLKIKDVELDMDEWRLALELELVTETELKESLKRSTRKQTIRVAGADYHS